MPRKRLPPKRLPPKKKSSKQNRQKGGVNPPAPKGLRHRLRRSLSRVIVLYKAKRKMEEMRKEHLAARERALVNVELLDMMSRGSDIAIPHTKPDPQWLEAYKTGAVEYRSYLLQLALRGIAVTEGARQAAKNLLDDYGFTFSFDQNAIMTLIKDVSELDMLYGLLQKTSLPPRLRDRVMTHASSGMFGPDRAKNNIASAVRNLSTPEHSPYGASNIIKVSDPNVQARLADLQTPSRLTRVQAPDTDAMRVSRLQRLRAKLRD